jgi:hypothetical protein
MLVMRVGPVRIFESHTTPDEAEAAYRARHNVEAAEIRPPGGKPLRLE